MKSIIKPENKNEVARYTIVRSEQTCKNCNTVIQKGCKVIVKTILVKRSVKREYYCLNCSELETL